MHKPIYDGRCKQNAEEKEYIGAYVAYYLRRYALNKSISIDGGSTNFQVIKAICKDIEDERPTVSSILTNHLNGIYLAKDFPEGVGPTWRCTGGILRTSRKTFVQINETQFKEIRTWVAVVGVNGFEPPFLQTTSQVEHEVKKAMIDAARYVVFPMDSSKWGCTAAENLINVNDMMIARQKVSFVTSFPIKYDIEANSDFNLRIGRFMDGLNQYINFCKGQRTYQTKMYTVEIAEDMLEMTEEEFQMSDNFNNTFLPYAKQLSYKNPGLVLRFDLWESNVGSLDF